MISLNTLQTEKNLIRDIIGYIIWLNLMSFIMSYYITALSCVNISASFKPLFNVLLLVLACISQNPQNVQYLCEK